MSDDDIRETYYRWVDEYHCLIGLGYQPAAPPTVETFISSWKSMGVWMPIDGTDSDNWTQTQYDEAKSKCTLEMFTDYRQFGAGASHFHGTNGPHDRPRALRLLAFAAALALLCTAAACGASGGSTGSPGSGTTRTPGAIWSPGAVSIPTGALDPFLQRMVDAGWQILQYNPQVSPPFYELSGPTEMDSAAVASEVACQALQPNGGWPTDDEIRKIYYRDVDEYNCLVGLGYQPDPPPSVETYVDSYRTGPWEPIDGVGWSGWSYDEWARMIPDPPLPPR
jgi:hypothetical protein